ncbi:hypothetical protein DMH25_01515 [Streptomyces sp. WAC 01325]|nr:hypothetical protein DMH25_01515 [Streptomyces sp. WAC 01325]
MQAHRLPEARPGAVRDVEVEFADSRVVVFGRHCIALLKVTDTMALSLPMPPERGASVRGLPWLPSGGGRDRRLLPYLPARRRSGS